MFWKRSELYPFLRRPLAAKSESPTTTKRYSGTLASSFLSSLGTAGLELFPLTARAKDNGPLRSVFSLRLSRLP